MIINIDGYDSEYSAVHHVVFGTSMGAYRRDKDLLIKEYITELILGDEDLDDDEYQKRFDAYVVPNDMIEVTNGKDILLDDYLILRSQDIHITYLGADPSAEIDGSKSGSSSSKTSSKTGSKTSSKTGSKTGSNRSRTLNKKNLTALGTIPKPQKPPKEAVKKSSKPANKNSYMDVLAKLRSRNVTPEVQPESKKDS
jgi:hypothetical protein